LVFDAFNGGFNGRLMDSYPLIDVLLGQTMGLTMVIFCWK
jgi:hypothetical protein